MSFTTRIKFLNNNKKKKDSGMTQLKTPPMTTATSPHYNNENPSEETEKYVDIDGIKFKITESEDDEGDVEHNEDAVSTTSSSHDLQKIKKRKPNQDSKNNKKSQKSKKDQKQDKLEKPKNDMNSKANKRLASLTKFGPSSALYPVCRAWMVNERESKYIGLDYVFTQYVKRPQNSLQLLKALIEDEVSCVSLMPAPVNNEIEINGTRASRVPAASGSQQQSNKTVLDDIVKRLEQNDTEDCPSTVGLLRDHLKHWKNVKANWKKHTRAYDEERYGVNFAILDTMFKMQVRKSN